MGYSCISTIYILQILLISLTILFLIVCFRTYCVDLTVKFSKLITTVEIVMNCTIVLDYFRNLIDSPIKRYYIFSMFLPSIIVTLRNGLLNFIAGIPVIVSILLPKDYSIVYSFVVIYILIFLTILSFILRRTFFFFIVLRNTKLWKRLITKARNREILVSLVELILFIISFGCSLLILLFIRLVYQL